MNEHLGYHEYERSDDPDYRNLKKTKKIRGNFGETESAKYRLSVLNELKNRGVAEVS